MLVPSVCVLHSRSRATASSNTIRCLSHRVLLDASTLSSPMLSDMMSALPSPPLLANTHDNARIICCAGLREFQLASGEDPRLRFVRPWSHGAVMDLLSDVKSPGHLEDPTTRKRVHYICGGVLRSLLAAKQMVGVYGSTPDGLDDVEAETRSAMKRSCDKWLKEASPVTLQKCTSSIANLVRGSTSWEDLKPAYDEGLVALAPQGRLRAVPVSSVAASVLHAALAELLRKNFKPLNASDTGAQRGFALEAQLHAVLDPCDGKLIPTYSLDGRARSLAVALRADYALPFLTAIEMTPAATKAVLYLPKSGAYPCDAVIVPAANDTDAPVILLESSVTPPTDDHRLDKVLAWFRSAPQRAQPDSAVAKRAPEEFGGFIDMVKAAHPTRRIVAVLCWLGRCEAGVDSGVSGTGADGSAGHADGSAEGVAAGSSGGRAAKTKLFNKKKQQMSKKQQLTDAAKTAGVELCVLDTPGLEMLGIRTH